MGTKNNPAEYDCYSKLDRDEPYFVLMGRDLAAPTLVRQWAYLRKRQIELRVKPEADMEQIEEAMRCADAMEAWQKARKAKAVAT